MRDHRRSGPGPASGDSQGGGGKPGGGSLTQRIPARREVPHRAQMEDAFGQDFSFVQAYTGAHEEMEGLGALAATDGDAVAFADDAPMPWLVAHELTHVVQQQQHGSSALAAKATIAPVESAAEHEADRVADRVVAGLPAGPITAPPSGTIHRFAPLHHRAATVGGLHDSFSAEEIGAIYASNWERDFSQGNALIANAAIAWTAIKNHAAAKKNDDPGPGAARFRDAVWKVVDASIFSATDESLGTYKYWEHMDHPTGGMFTEKQDAPDAKAAERWGKQASGLAGYIADSKAHIKDQMVAAIDVYREQHKLGAVGGSIDNWGGVARPEGYVDRDVERTSKGKVTSALPASFNDPEVSSRKPIVAEATTDAKAAGAKSNPKHDFAGWSLVAQHLGRAMHAFEDFWAHSNWLELAKKLKEQQAGGGPVKPVEPAQLKTGTFETPAKAHALGHKLLALASGMQRDFPLLLKVYGLKKASTKLDGDKARKKHKDQDGNELPSDRERAFGALETDSFTTIGEISDVGSAANEVEELVQEKKYKMHDFLCNESWLEALANKGRILIAQGDANSDADSHGKLAKDQPEGDGHKDHGGALAVASKANELVFGPLRAIMDQKDPDAALAATEAQLALVDTMLQVPSTSHPLFGVVGSGSAHPHP